jgi:hypothetical protein
VPHSCVTSSGKAVLGSRHSGDGLVSATAARDLARGMRLQFRLAAMVHVVEPRGNELLQESIPQNSHERIKEGQQADRECAGDPDVVKIEVLLVDVRFEHPADGVAFLLV